MQTQLTLCSLGFGYVICVNRVRVVVPVTPKPIQRILRDAKLNNRWIDACRGRKARSLVILDDSTVITCCFNPITVLDRFNKATAYTTEILPIKGKERKGEEYPEELADIEDEDEEGYVPDDAEDADDDEDD